MNPSIASELEIYENRINKKRFQFVFNLMNLCIKSEPATLMPMGVRLGGSVVRIEDAADVVKPDDFSLILIPKNGASITALMNAVNETHPEFIQEKMPVRKSADTDEIVVLLKLTMPEVDKIRHEVLTKGVGTYKDAFNLGIEREKGVLTAKVAKYLLNATKEEQEEYKKAVDDKTNVVSDIVEETAGQKLADIDDAYAAYQEKHKDMLESMREKAAAVNETAANSMRME